jgi:CheY-like chemotaxis protein
LAKFSRIRIRFRGLLETGNHATDYMAGRATILVVEDDTADAYFLEKAFERILANCAVQRVSDGEEARAYLQGADKYADRAQYPLPSVILLDLRMPRMNGFEFLAWLRSEPELKIIPAVVYSSSENPADIKKAYEMGANSFLHKRISMNAVQETMRSFARYWLEDCGRPPLE